MTLADLVSLSVSLRTSRSVLFVCGLVPRAKPELPLRGRFRAGQTWRCQPEVHGLGSPRWLRSKAFSFVGDSMMIFLPATLRSFCSRSFASVRDNVSLTVPNSAASTRLVIVSSIVTDPSDFGLGHLFTSQLARRVSTSLSAKSSSWLTRTRKCMPESSPSIAPRNAPPKNCTRR